MIVLRAPRINLKRVYEAPASEDGSRLLVERLWPRGLSRDAVRIDRWFKTIAPSTELRRWFAHAPERWPEFKKRYLEELECAPQEVLDELTALCEAGHTTFVFAAGDELRNSAVVLRGFILQKFKAD